MWQHARDMQVTSDIFFNSIVCARCAMHRRLFSLAKTFYAHSQNVLPWTAHCAVLTLNLAHLHIIFHDVATPPPSSAATPPTPAAIPYASNLIKCIKPSTRADTRQWQYMLMQCAASALCMYACACMYAKKDFTNGLASTIFHPNQKDDNNNKNGAEGKENGVYVYGFVVKHWIKSSAGLQPSHRVASPSCETRAQIATETLFRSATCELCAHFQYPETGKSQLFNVNEMNIWVFSVYILIACSCTSYVRRNDRRTNGCEEKHSTCL